MISTGATVSVSTRLMFVPVTSMRSLACATCWAQPAPGTMHRVMLAPVAVATATQSFLVVLRFMSASSFFGLDFRRSAFGASAKHKQERGGISTICCKLSQFGNMASRARGNPSGYPGGAAFGYLPGAVFCYNFKVRNGDGRQRPFFVCEAGCRPGNVAPRDARGPWLRARGPRVLALGL